MCLALNARETTLDIDAIFQPKVQIMNIVDSLTDELNLDKGWFNDGVKGFLSQNDDVTIFLQLSNLRVNVATPEYMFAMKALSCKTNNINEINDLRFLIKYINITSMEQAEAIIYQYYSMNRILPKTVYTLMELIDYE